MRKPFVVLAIRPKDGRVKTTLPDGRSVYLKALDAIDVIAQRHADNHGMTVRAAKKELGINDKTFAPVLVARARNITVAEAVAFLKMESELTPEEIAAVQDKIKDKK
jgi:hypothetical protein